MSKKLAGWLLPRVNVQVETKNEWCLTRGHTETNNSSIIHTLGSSAPLQSEFLMKEERYFPAQIYSLLMKKEKKEKISLIRVRERSFTRGSKFLIRLIFLCFTSVSK